MHRVSAGKIFTACNSGYREDQEELGALDIVIFLISLSSWLTRTGIVFWFAKENPEMFQVFCRWGSGLQSEKTPAVGACPPTPVLEYYGMAHSHAAVILYLLPWKPQLKTQSATKSICAPESASVCEKTSIPKQNLCLCVCTGEHTHEDHACVCVCFYYTSSALVVAFAIKLNLLIS